MDNPQILAVNGHTKCGAVAGHRIFHEAPHRLITGTGAIVSGAEHPLIERPRPVENALVFDAEALGGEHLQKLRQAERCRMRRIAQPLDLVVQFAGRRILGPDRIHQENPAFGLHHPAHLRERGFRTRHVVEGELAGDQIEAAAGVRQLFGLAEIEGRIRDAALRLKGPRLAQHFRRQIDAAGAYYARRGGQNEGAWAASHVQDYMVGPKSGKFETFGPLLRRVARGEFRKRLGRASELFLNGLMMPVRHRIDFSTVNLAVGAALVAAHVTAGQVSGVSGGHKGRPYREISTPPARMEDAILDLRIEAPHCVPIPAGSFLMGSETGRDEERPVHRVWVDAFEMAVLQVRNRDYAVFLDATGHSPPKHWRDSDLNHPEQPVVAVRWTDAVRYCEWLSEMREHHYRLPTEAEWERASRGGREGIDYPWGNESPDDWPEYVERWGRIGERDLEIRGPLPVGRGTPNPYSLFDISENVHEWCADWFSRDYYSQSPERNPQGPDSGARRASRGGSWRHQIKISRCAARASIPPEFEYADYGFRVVRDPSADS